jgi:ABC-2 type transport system permease protein
MSYLSKFIAYGKMEFKTGIAYRFQFMASVVISPLMLLLYYFVWQSIYTNTGANILGYSFSDMITYYVLVMIVGHFIFNMVGNDLQEKILYGDLTQDMLKPFSIFSQFLSKTLADRVFAFFVEVLPVFFISFIIFRLKIVSIAAICFFIIALLLSFLLNFLISFLMGIFSFWVSRIDSIQWLLFFFIRFLSGEFIPLDFLGATVLGILKVLPFYYIRYGLVQVYLGKLSFGETLSFLGIQVIWILILYFFIRVLLAIALKKYGAQGG